MRAVCIGIQQEKLIVDCLWGWPCAQVSEALETELLECRYDVMLCKQAIKTKQQEKADRNFADVVDAYIVYQASVLLLSGPAS